MSKFGGATAAVFDIFGALVAPPPGTLVPTIFFTLAIPIAVATAAAPILTAKPPAVFANALCAPRIVSITVAATAAALPNSLPSSVNACIALAAPIAKSTCYWLFVCLRLPVVGS